MNQKLFRVTVTRAGKRVTVYKGTLPEAQKLCAQVRNRVPGCTVQIHQISWPAQKDKMVRVLTRLHRDLVETRDTAVFAPDQVFVKVDEEVRSSGFDMLEDMPGEWVVSPAVSA